MDDAQTVTWDREARAGYIVLCTLSEEVTVSKTESFQVGPHIINADYAELPDGERVVGIEFVEG